MPAKRSKLTPAQRAKRAAKRARRAAAPLQPASSAPSETLPATLERLGVRAPLDPQGAVNASDEVRRDGAEDEAANKECCSQC